MEKNFEFNSTKVNGGQIESINGSDAREIISNLILLLRIIINNKEIVGVLVRVVLYGPKNLQHLQNLQTFASL